MKLIKIYIYASISNKVHVPHIKENNSTNVIFAVSNIQIDFMP